MRVYITEDKPPFKKGELVEMDEHAASNAVLEGWAKLERKRDTHPVPARETR